MSALRTRSGLLDPYTREPYTVPPPPAVPPPSPVERRWLSPSELAALADRPPSRDRMPRPIAGLNFEPSHRDPDQAVKDALCAVRVAECGGDMRRAAAVLGCSYQTVARRMRRVRERAEG